MSASVQSHHACVDAQTYSHPKASIRILQHVLSLSPRRSNRQAVSENDQIGIRDLRAYTLLQFLLPRLLPHSEVLHKLHRRLNSPRASWRVFSSHWTQVDSRVEVSITFKTAFGAVVVPIRKRQVLFLVSTVATRLT